MFDISTFPTADAVRRAAQLSQEDYQRLYRQSIEQPDTFWAEQAKAFLDWITPWHTVHRSDINTGAAQWFAGGQLNVSYNCIDRHLGQRADQPAFIWEGDDPAKSSTITYRQLHQNVSRLANVLKSRGVKKGDRVCIYMPMIPEAAYAMLACTRIGAVHSVVFGGFSPDALRDRILDADCRTVITADEGVRGGKPVALKQNVDKALASCPNVSTVLVVERTGADLIWVKDRDIKYRQALDAASDDCPPEPMDAEDPLFILYTSGSTGKPKGVLHTTGGYLLQAAMTFKYVLDYRDGEVFWCTADVGWVTGHSYIVYGPLANGATSLMFEGVPSYPDSSRFWQVIDKHKVNIFYTAPTALRALMREGHGPLENTSRASLRLLGSVGEPINPEAWDWYFNAVGEQRCPIVDTWWQTETGGIMLSPLVSAQRIKPGCATQPMFGVQPVLLDEHGKAFSGAGSGVLAIKASWPGQIRSVYGDPQRMIDTYFKPYPGYYFTGDGARRDEDGDYWITGRIDDVINVSGHRIGTAEVESALVLHDQVAEAAVVGYPHDVKGQGIYAFVTPMNGVEPSDALKKHLLELVSKEIGSFAKPELIQWAPALPKTRSGKIMRRILRKIACNELDSLGDTSTLADPSVVEGLIDKRLNR
ncbi:acetate--CoA ligase [Pseudomonas fluorescens group sp.]|uniref:Acetyl-coenzyme A synthetase n=2 Tax=Pseudomonas fluorescens TaxID=294 RepID=C3K250_PSEFS|nr:MULTISPECIES: acetate--CoA ligase [Pseudomonas fluorescens group]MBZ6457442.1 acetate--CoA ligase [Pseudomonas fluorescens group sp.]MBZ6463918.1 acetate--CoA ligase [Pseudomonas fluorescens group sp.]MBZ6470270.1 acetate--CoA ligase [Pseudomonas fluorescens group sp.]WQD71520.1 acetate--CoA ligase [Pseudomonas marginalis]CAI2799390.1 Acetyl-coenzyme A synthetase (AcCoA synthetase) (Acs) (EC (Acetate--CoA ligase) (Acyl-activating enzyme) [Pseudomonas fluorescens SBW25]